MMREAALRTVTVALPCEAPANSEAVERLLRRIESWARHPVITRLLLLHQHQPLSSVLWGAREFNHKLQFIELDSWLSGLSLGRILDATSSDALLLQLEPAEVTCEPRGLEQFLATLEYSGAGLVYSDFRQLRGREVLDYATVDYQPGSSRDSFDFGRLVVVSRPAAEQVQAKYGLVDSTLKWGGFYDLRLKLATDYPVVRIPEALYVEQVPTRRSALPEPGKAAHSPELVDTDSPSYQQEAEQIFTAHLKRIGAYVAPVSAPLPPPGAEFPVTASVIIPVFNRAQTIVAAIDSALKQITSFDYNIIVVDHHSTDQTTALVRQLASNHRKIVHKIPHRRDLGIGGLWNEAIYSPACGLYAVQLDSDDVYAHSRALEMMIGELRGLVNPGRAGTGEVPRYAMAVGAYTYVDVELQTLPAGLAQQPGLSLENGRNNLLRLDGPGAPRAYYVPVLRRVGFPNVSYGEDYAVALRLSRHYQIGRVFDSLCLARQWPGNTSRSLPLGNIKSTSLNQIMTVSDSNPAELLVRLRPVLVPLMAATRNHYNVYKDYLRTVEIQARMKRA